MSDAFPQWLGPVANIATIIGALSLVLTFITLKLQRRELSHQIIDKCGARFNNLVDDLLLIRESDIQFEHLTRPLTVGEQLKTRLSVARQYVDLCNLELFYFENRYVDRRVQVEWLDGMLSLIPFYGTNNAGELQEEPLNTAELNHATTDLITKAQEGYQRVRYVFRANARQTRAIRAKLEADPSGELSEAARVEMIAALCEQIESYPTNSYLRAFFPTPYYLVPRVVVRHLQ